MQNTRGGGHLYFKLDIILVIGLSKHTLNTYFSGMKIDPKYVFLHVFLLICPSCPFQNLSIWPKTHPFSNFTHFCTPKRCTRVHCLVLKNNPNYVNFFTRMISNFKYKWSPGQNTHYDSKYQVSWGWSHQLAFSLLDEHVFNYSLFSLMFLIFLHILVLQLSSLLTWEAPAMPLEDSI